MAVSAATAWGYSLITNDSGQPIKWPAGLVTIQIMVDNTAVLSDGSTRATSIQTAAQLWNAQIASVQFSPQITAVGTGGVDDNHINEIFFSAAPYSYGWDNNTLAITTDWYDGGTQRKEGDIIFNTAFTWDSYRGSTQATGSAGPYDIRRVALHELGHVLGLDHPDQANPVQNVAAIMNSVISNIDALQADDIAGAQALYAAPVTTSVPVITSDQATVSTTPGQYSQFMVYASASPAPVYQWQRLPVGGTTWNNLNDNEIFSGTHASTLTLAGLSLMNGDQLHCVVSNSAGSVTSMTRTLTIAPAADALAWVDISFPSSGATGSLTSGTAKVINAGTQAWGGNHRLILTGPGFAEAGSASLSGIAPGQSVTVTIYFTVPITPGLSTGYTLQASESGVGAFGELRSISFYTFGANVAPTIYTQPIGRVANLGDNITFTVVALGQAPFSYQWLLNGAAIPGEKSDTLTLSNVQLSAAGTYTVAVTNGLGSATSNPAVLTVDIPPGVVSVTAAGNFTMFTRSDGGRWVLGDGQYGQLGGGSNIAFSSQPLEIDTGVAIIAGSEQQSAFIKLDGTLWAMGANAGSLGGSNTNYLSSPIQVIGGTNVAAVSLGYADTYFIRADGSLWGAGGNRNGELGDGTQNIHQVPEQIAFDVAAVSGGYSHAIFQKSDGTVWGMGYGNSGALGNGIYNDVQSNSNATPVLIAVNAAAISAGANYSLILKSDGSLWSMGLGLPYSGDPLSPIATNVSKIVAGEHHCLFIKTDGTVWAMGKNNAGQLGDGTTTDRTTPVQIVTGVVGIAAGAQHSLFIRSDGSLWGMGSNQYYQLGYQVGAGTNTPVLIASGVVQAPLPPPSASATDGSLAGTVRISWTHATGASDYEIWRNTVNSSTGATNLGTVTNRALFYDMSGTVGAVYYYWVKAMNSGGISGFSPSDSGYSIIPTPPVFISQPVNYTYIYNSYSLPAFIAVATGNPAPTYRWQVLGVGGSLWTDMTATDPMLAGVTGSTLAFTSGPFSFFNGLQYRCVATNSAGTATSSSATLTLRPAPPSQGDFNGDGQADLLWQNTVTGERTVWLMGNTSVLNAVPLTNVPPDWQIAGYGDFNGDGKTDLVWQNAVTGDRTLWLMNGTTLSSALYLANLPLEWQIAGVRDFNSDGKPDLIWQNTVTGELSIWLMNGTTLASVVPLPRVTPDWQIAGVGDFNIDGQPDLIWQNTFTGERSIWLMNGTNFRSAVSLGTVPAMLQIVGVDDFNRDGSADLLWTNTVTGERSIWLMHGTSHFSTISLGTIGLQWSLGRPIAAARHAGADFNGDGKSDLVWENTTTGDRYVWLMNGTTVSSGVFIGNVPVQWHLAGTGDFNGDGQTDLIWENTVTGDRYVWLMHGTTLSSAEFLGNLPIEWHIAGTGDFNRDGKTDLVWENTVTGDRYAWLMNGTTLGSAVFLGNVPVQWHVAATGDFNFDGQTDLVWENSVTGDRYIWLMNGTTLGAALFLGNLPNEWHIAGTGDFNGDGQTDLVWQNTATGDRYVWLMSGTTLGSAVYVGNVPVQWHIRD